MINNFFVFLFTNWRNKKFQQRGVVLLVAVVVMGIIVAIVLGVSIILLSELKMVRNMGNSVVAFYAADTGVEKTLYYDRKIKDAGWSRGVCDICNSCLDCDDCSVSGSGCDSATCTDCQIEYTTDLINKIFKMTVTVSSGNDIYQSSGTYKSVTRAIELSGTAGGWASNPGPTIENIFAIPSTRSVPEGTEIEIMADIYDVDGLDLSTLKAEIRGSTENYTVVLENISGDTYGGTWSGPIGVYYVDITACDTLGNCTIKENI